MFESIGATASALAQQRDLADEGLATSRFLALEMGKPLFLEGEPGVGKTEGARVAAVLETSLIRVQCDEGFDLEQAVCDGNDSRLLFEPQARRVLDAGCRRGPSRRLRPLVDSGFLLEVHDDVAQVRSAIASGERVPVEAV